MEAIHETQQDIFTAIEKLAINIKKDTADRKSADYFKRRLQNLESYWSEYQHNHDRLQQEESRTHPYFTSNKYDQAFKLYKSTYTIINEQYQTYVKKPMEEQSAPDIPVHGSQYDYTSQAGPSKQVESEIRQEQHSSTKEQSRGTYSKLDDQIKKQMSNFRAFSRTVQNINVEVINEKWELEDNLKTLESRWSVIDKIHWELDSELEGNDKHYEDTFSKHEMTYIALKRSLNRKVFSMSHRELTTPKIEVPTFHGSHQQWVPFKDLFAETIHNNTFLSNAQKMQFLKSKVKGEAERLIQHLTISSDNYTACWDILNQRYNNKKLIFSSHINVFLNLPTMQQPSINHIKRLHDTTLEILNGIKNLGVDVSTWDPLLVHILCHKLDSETHAEYVTSIKKPRDLPILADFLSFLELKFTSIESSRRKQDNNQKSNQLVAKPSTIYSNQKPLHYKQTYSSNKISNDTDIAKPTSNNKFHASKSCPVCKREHGVFHCKQFLEMSPTCKKECISKFNLCQNCLYDHKGNECFSTKRCREKGCYGCHNTILHDLFKQNDQQNTNTHVTQQNEMPEILLSTAMIKVEKADGSYQILRALVDSASQTSLITENAAQQLALSRQKCKGVISGIGARDNNCKGVINIACTSMSCNYQFNTDAYIMKSLTKHLPTYTFSKPSWDYLDNIQLADSDFNISRPVDILLGADVYPNIILEGICRSDQSSMIAQQTRLGWILCGNIKQTSVQCNVVQVNTDEIQKFWEVEDINEETPYSSEDLECVQFYQSTTERLEDGRYQVRLPLNPNYEEKLGQSKAKAIAQFHHLEKKLSKNLRISNEYKSFINEYQTLGHMQLSQSSSNETPECYLPHHCVLRDQSSSTALRVVFNASAKNSHGITLNELMKKGPNLQQDLQTLILKWRQYKIALTADIEKMFRQIWVHPDDQQLQKIIWRDSHDQMLREYQLTTVTYGTKAAPWLAMMTLKQLANDERKTYPEASKVLEEAFYMDDLVHGCHSITEAKKLQQDLIKLLKRGGFNLRKWSSNDTRLLQQQENHGLEIKSFKQAEITKTLGLHWNPTEDKFTFSSTINTLGDKVTKRMLLSEISKIFDPLGWILPLTTKLKIIFKEVWMSNIQWDDEVPENINKNWSKIKADLEKVNQLHIPRWLGTTPSSSFELHGFCDASINAYASVIYCKINNGKNQTKITLVAAKSRLVPSSKNISLPRLELCGALLLSKLMAKVIECLPGYNIKIYGWCDSTAVLGWLQGDPGRWKSFVANRTCQIKEIMPASCWAYVKSQENPADSASRGLSVPQLITDSLWWQGPTWLPTYNPEKDEKQRHFVTEEEVKNQKQVHDQKQNDQKQSTSATNRSSSKPALQKSRIKLLSLFASIILFLGIVTNSQCELNVTSFRNNQHLYFDKISNMNIIRDEWKLIIYYKREPYWEGIRALNKSTIAVQRACNSLSNKTYCNIILFQLQHELSEIDYNNQLLLSQQDGTTVVRRERSRRGLVDGVGYLASALFGVLDSRFAEKYEKDIALLRTNQQHTLSLWKNQTSIIEAEFNLIKRVENVMSHQHKIIQQQLFEIKKAVELAKTELQIASEFTMGALITSNLLQNLKHLQGILIDTITDVYHGRFNPYLIPPKQLQDQLSTISSQLSSDVTLPINNIHVGISRIYKLITTKARMISDYLLFELRIPLISRDSFEMFKIIPIPVAKQDIMINIKPISDYVAINLKKDTYLTLSENSISSCLLSESYLCHITKPIYRMGGDNELCVKREGVCETVISPCNNIWLETNALNSYIYFCCNQCNLRTMCGDKITAHQLYRAGIITVQSACLVKTESFEVATQENLSTKINIRSDIYAPLIAPINNIINISIIIPEDILNNSDSEINNNEFRDIKQKIEVLKQNEPSILTDHDIHHYAAIYVMMGVLLMGGAILWWKRARGTWRLWAPPASTALGSVPSPAIDAPGPARTPATTTRDQCTDYSVVYNRVNESARVHRASSPINIRSDKFTV